MSLKTRILSSQLAMAIVPAALIAAVLVWQCGRGFKTAICEAGIGLKANSEFAKEGLTAVGLEDLAHVAAGIDAMCRAQQELLQQKLDGDLKVAQLTLANLGVATLAKETATWKAVNQLSGTPTEISLPKMIVGQTWLGQIARITEPAPLVDQVTKIVGSTCTLFQRMNDTERAGGDVSHGTDERRQRQGGRDAGGPGQCGGAGR